MKNFNTRFYACSISIAIYLFLPLSVFAITGEDIARQVYDRPVGKTSFTVSKVSLSKNAEIFEEREMETFRDKTVVSQEKNLIKFNTPSLIRGTALLQLKNEDGSENTYLYLPSLGKERMINGSQKQKRFADTEFTYEDLESREVDRDEHKLLGEETIEGKAYYLLESTPKDSEDSLYAKKKSWIDKTSLMPLKIEFFDKKNELSKVFKNHKQQIVQGFWTIVDSEMLNLESNRKTRIVLRETKYDLEINKDKFSANKLKDL